MLKLAKDLDQDRRIDCFICGWIALDPERGWHLRRSAGRVRTGSKHKYWLHTEMPMATPIRAFTDEEAVMHANKRLAPGKG